jgi:hypothetical protein
MQLPPRDTRAKEVEGLEALSSSSSTSEVCTDKQQQQQPPGQAHSNADLLPSAAAAAMSSQQQQPASGPDSGGTAAATALHAVHEALQEELQQLRSSYLLLQEEYWRQKERLMALDLDTAQLKAASQKAADTAAQVCVHMRGGERGGGVAQRSGLRSTGAASLQRADVRWQTVYSCRRCGFGDACRAVRQPNHN